MGLTPLSRSPEHQVDGTDPVLPGVLVNGTTGLIPSPVCSGERDNGASPVYLFIPGLVYVVHGPVTALVLSPETCGAHGDPGEERAAVLRGDLRPPDRRHPGGLH